MSICGREISKTQLFRQELYMNKSFNLSVIIFLILFCTSFVQSQSDKSISTLSLNEKNNIDGISATKDKIFPLTFGIDIGLNGFTNSDAIKRVWKYSTDATPETEEGLGVLSSLNLGFHGEYYIQKIRLWVGFYGHYNNQKISGEYKQSSGGFYYWNGFYWVYYPSTSTNFSRSLSFTNLTFGGSLAYIFAQQIDKVNGILQGYSELRLGSANLGMSRYASDVTVPKEEVTGNTLSTTVALGLRMFSIKNIGFDVKLSYTMCNFKDILWNGHEAAYLDGNKEKVQIDFTHFGLSFGLIF